MLTDEQSFRALQKMKMVFYAQRFYYAYREGPHLVEGTAFARAAEELKKVFDSPRQESKKFSTNEVSPSDGQEMKNFNPVLFETSPSSVQGFCWPSLQGSLVMLTDEESAQALQKLKMVFYAQRFYYTYREVEPNEKPKLRKVSSDSDLSLSPPSERKGGKKVDTDLVEGSAFAIAAEELKEVFDSPRQESKKFSTNLFEVSYSDGQAEMKDFNPNLVESSSTDGEESKKFSTNLFEVSPSDGQDMKNFNPLLFEGSPSGGQGSWIVESKKFGTNLFELSPPDGQEMKDFNRKLLESSSFDGEEKEESAPNFFKVLCCNGQGTQNSFFEDIEFSIARELTDSWFVPVDDRQAKKSDISKRLDGSSSTKKESMWDDDDDSSVDEELLNGYLEILDAEDLTKKEVEVKVDPSLSEVKGDGYHLLTQSEKLDWITLQFILERYDPCPMRDPLPEPPSLSGESARPEWVFDESVFDESDEDESDYEDSDQDESHDEDSDQERIVSRI